MKINTIRTLPKKLGIAFSGGVDSCVLLDVALRLKRDVTILVFDHNNETSKQEVEFGKKVADNFGLPIIFGNTDKKLAVGESKEKFWSECRNTWFHNLDIVVATGHHLNDVAEWYLMTALTGKGGHYMSYSNKNIIRPLIVTEKSMIENYALKNSVDHIVDRTNFDIDFNKRNRVRIELMPIVNMINAGFLNTMKRNVIRKEFSL